MTEQNLLEANLARWLEPAGVQLDNERVPLYLQAALEMSGDLAGRELDIVRAVHGELNDDLRAWVATVVRKHDQGFVGEGKDALIARLAGAAVVHALTSRIAPDTILVNLAIESARFLELTPVIADTAALSPLTLLRTAKQVRERTLVAGTAAETVAKLRQSANQPRRLQPLSPPRSSRRTCSPTARHCVLSQPAWTRRSAQTRNDRARLMRR